MRRDIAEVERAASRKLVIAGTSYGYQTTVALWRARVHVFWREDPGEALHDHPWAFWTFPLVAYVEEVLDPGGTPRVLRQVVPARSWTRREATHTHRVLGRWSGRGTDVAPGPVVTFVWRGRHERAWSYVVPRGGRVHRFPWRAYLARVDSKPRRSV